VTYLGIDFSGDAARWKHTVSTARQTVWIAKVRQEASVKVEWVRPIQDFCGNEPPFQRLANFLRRGDFVAAGIDAPFSIPKPNVRSCGGWKALIKAVDALALYDGRPFPKADQFLEMVNGGKRTNALRCTEQYWRSRRVNVRSTLWWKHRGGAPFTAACMKLIASAGQPCWPWAPANRGTLVEAFPAAQLRQWCLDHQGYSGSKGDVRRNRIVDNLSIRIEFGACETQVRQSPDALDAVLAAFAAIAVVNERAVVWPAGSPIDDEGWIGVYE
jgi:Protein of unknown function (DUF429)